jgi:probable phosphoglycerate mutase
MVVLFRMYIVRHGETEWNRSRRIQGQLDVPLNETGIKQAGLAAEVMKGVPLAKAFSSDLQRASKVSTPYDALWPRRTLLVPESC